MAIPHLHGFHDLNIVLTQNPGFRSSLTSKFAYLYSNSGPHPSLSRSISVLTAAYLLYEQSDPSNQPLATALSLTHLHSLPIDYLGSLTFEASLQTLIDYIEDKINPVSNQQTLINYRKLCEILQIAVTVWKENEDFGSEKHTFWPEIEGKNEFCHINVVEIQPYFLLIPWKFVPFLASKTPIPMKFRTKKRALGTKKDAFERISPILQIQTSNFLLFSSELLTRFEELISKNELENTFSSHEFGKSLQKLLHFSEFEAFYRDFGVEDEINFLKNIDKMRLFAFFTRICSVENCSEIRDIGLQCGHNYCPGHFSQLIESFRSLKRPLISQNSDQTALFCPICSVPIPGITIKTYNSELYNCLISEGDDYLGVTICSICTQTRSKRVIVKLNCGHAVCVFCGKKVCCYQSEREIIAWTKSLELKCDGCGEIYPGIHFAQSSCEFHHIFCQFCSYQIIKRKICVACRIPLASSNMSLLQKNARAKCQICGQIHEFAESLETQCECVICMKCAVNLVVETGSYDTCWNDSTPLSDASREKLRLLSHIDDAEKCSFCTRNVPIPDLKLTCNHRVHTACLIQKASKCLLAEPNPQRIQCNCGIEVLGTLVPNYWEQPVHPRITEFLKLNPREIEVHCRVCGLQDPAVSYSVDYMQPIRKSCGGSCGRVYCALCLEDWEEEIHGRGGCKMLTARQTIHSLEHRGFKAVQCPYCRLAQKQGSTKWQKCECENYFCALCAVRYDVVQCHGDSYHRPDCPLRSSEVKETGFSVSCSMCQVMGGDQACDPPKRLARSCQFASFELAHH